MGVIMFARDIMNKDVVMCTGEIPLSKVYELMQDKECEFVSVVEDYAHKNPIGVITEHDICLNIIGKERNPRGLLAASVMNSKVVRVSEVSSINHCVNLLDGDKRRILLVVDENGSFCGTISLADLEVKKNLHQTELLNRSSFLSEFGNPGINRIF